ncbi:MAG: hypothetical protein R2851_08570 [Caldilineaceae bacterium]
MPSGASASALATPAAHMAENERPWSSRWMGSTHHAAGMAA